MVFPVTPFFPRFDILNDRIDDGTNGVACTRLERGGTDPTVVVDMSNTVLER